MFVFSERAAFHYVKRTDFGIPDFILYLICQRLKEIGTALSKSRFAEIFRCFGTDIFCYILFVSDFVGSKTACQQIAELL